MHMRKQAKLGAAWVIVAAALVACNGSSGSGGSPSDNLGGAAGADGSGGATDATGGQDGSGGNTGGSDTGGSDGSGGNTGGSDTGGSNGSGGNTGGANTGGTSTGGTSTGGTNTGGTGTGGTGTGGAGPVVGNVIFRDPETLVGDDGSNQQPLPAPNGELEMYGLTPNGRLIVTEPSSQLGVKSIVSMLPNGTDRIVLVDGATLPADTQNVFPVALTLNDFVYYQLLRASTSTSGNPDVYLGVVSSNGSQSVAAIQLSGGTTGVTNAVFLTPVPFSGTRNWYRDMRRLFTTNGALLVGLSGANGAAHTSVVKPDLSMTTAVTVTYDYYESVCGITPSGRVIYTKSRGPGGFAWDVWSVNSDGSDNVRLNNDAFQTYSCEVMPSGTVIVSSMDAQYNKDIYAWNGLALVPVATTGDAEVVVTETADGRLVYQAQDLQNSHTSLHIVEPDGTDMVTLSPKDDSAGPFGGLIAVSDERAVFTRSTIFGGPGTVHSVLLNGTSRLFLAEGSMNVGPDGHGTSSNGRLVYRNIGNGSASSVRLYSMRLDTVISPGVPDQVILSNDSTSYLGLLLP